MKEEVHEKLKEIKQSFRLLMNGETLRSMKEKGLDYHLNWGVNILDLRKMADEIGENYDLAIALWKENIRECKILATMLMPHNLMEKDMVELWMEQTEEQEIAEQAVFNLYQHLRFAPELSFKWIASDRDVEQLSGYLLLCRLFMKGFEPDVRRITEYIDQLQCALRCDSHSIRHAAMNCVMRFAELSEMHENIAKKALKNIDLELF
ncbi:MAG: DNA alkylation repair protein [Prevotella sp.]|nr:DNA alkylation repair protein [Prevotella sp.]